MPELNRPNQAHFFADFDQATLGAVDRVDESGDPASLWSDAWDNLRRRPLFWVSAVLIVLVIAVAAFPGLFSSLDPRFCELKYSLDPPRGGHPFGFDRQGCDIYSRTIYGARASVLVGVLTTIVVTLLGSVVGAFAGFYGGWFDSVLSRITDIFFAIPLVLAAIVVMQMFKDDRTVTTVVIVLGVFGWPQIARITRGAVMSVRNADFITAAKALGSSRLMSLARHVMPNSAAPIIVTATVSLGIFIVAEATLSFLGIGLPPSITSWGADISKAQTSLRSQPSVLFYPAGALALTVLSFIMMGDAVRDALDPKARKR
ncbi:ABC transporter permease [Pengzhenrongella sicca]|uniref:ABC transporter permease n=1 Tax=Pengzhenrongella sicca TaxID=2819238 RepID=A0A8A4ZBP5_9MICO|nr:ABC transporter permease [Pengzhenrongella sicca]QTE28825.1 ABC transporter permease [Pengzhenrongella sicca]